MVYPIVNRLQGDVPIVIAGTTLGLALATAATAVTFRQRWRAVWLA